MGLVPTSTDYTVEKGDRGVVPWAVQRALNDRSAPNWGDGLPVVEDGIFGEQTRLAVKSFQEASELKGDGRFGQKTSAAMAAVLGAKVPTSVAPGLVRGIVQAESGNLIGAVNTSVPGGIDCGYVQRRVYEADYSDQAVVRRAFDGLYQMNLLAKTLRSRHDAFYGRPGAKTHKEAWKLAALHHNYPYAADQISKLGVNNLSSYWTTPASWVEAIGAKWADGEPVQTPLDWCRYYALGSALHQAQGVTTQFVTSWPT